MPRDYSLKALKAFESATRNGSFAQAAKELSITPAAVSQLIRNLENTIGRKLFHRINRRIVVTEAGLEIQPHVSKAFEELTQVAQKLVGNNPHKRLVISVPNSVAIGWLSQRIHRFCELYGKLDFSLRGENDPVSFENSSIDIRMTYGNFFYPQFKSIEILNDVVFPACSPGYLNEFGPFNNNEQLKSASLIHTDWGSSSATFPTWKNWFEQNGRFENSLGSLDIPGITANSSRAAIDLAVGGLGIVLCQGMLSAEHIRQEKLVRISNQQINLAYPYFLTIPENKRKRQVVLDFKNWLIKEMSTELNSV